MMRIRLEVLALMMLLLPLVLTSGIPIKAQVPIYVPANLPVTGTVCLPSTLAAGLKAKLYVDGMFADEGAADEIGCYKVTIKPLPSGRHNLYAEVYEGSIKIAEITAEVIAIKGMIVAKPDPLAIFKRGEEKEVTLYLENRSPVNLSNVRVEIDAPFSIFAHHMMRVRDFVVSGSLGDLLVNETKELKLILAVPKNFRPGDYKLKINLTYEVASSSYTIPLEVGLVVSEEVVSPSTQTGSISTSSTEAHESSTSVEIGSVGMGTVPRETVPAWIFILLLILSAVVVAVVLFLVSRPR
ncbi:MAG: hypothetical protein J7L91_05695 [Candidatus Korarchaeota archaeon]|nr:hypothetical protein [Candidatus Korarchaeota archaeon]